MTVRIKVQRLTATTTPELVYILLPKGCRLISASVVNLPLGTAHEIALFLSDPSFVALTTPAILLPLAHGVQDSGNINELAFIWQADTDMILDEWRQVGAAIYNLVAGETADLVVAFDV